jgi:metal-responsive CopG/Arc/MetJ family transcriptional regulator
MVEDLRQETVGVGIALYERQLRELEELGSERGSPGRSAVLRQLVDEYLRERPILRIVEARRRNLITHQEAVDKFATLIERDGGNGKEE